MKLYLAVAVLMLVFVAYTEAQEETIQERLARFNLQVQEHSRNLAERAKTAFEDINVKSSTWFQEQLKKMKDMYEERFQ